jgi:hypothetical protein
MRIGSCPEDITVVVGPGQPDELDWANHFLRIDPHPDPQVWISGDGGTRQVPGPCEPLPPTPHEEATMCDWSHVRIPPGS